VEQGKKRCRTPTGSPSASLGQALRSSLEARDKSGQAGTSQDKPALRKAKARKASGVPPDKPSAGHLSYNYCLPMATPVTPNMACPVKLGPTLKTEGWGTRKVKNVREILRTKSAKSLRSPAGQTIGGTPELQLLPPDGHSNHAEQGVLVKLGPTLKIEGWGTRKVKNVWEILRTKSAKSLRSPAALNSKALTRRRRET